jgi:hypothetical protein
MGTGLLLTSCSVIGRPAWIGANVGLIYARKMLGDASAELIANWITSVLLAASRNFKDGVHSVRDVFSLPPPQGAETTPDDPEPTPA